MSHHQIEHLSVIGAGQMGSGIAQVFACQGYQVTLVDQHNSMLEKAKQGIHSSVEKLCKKGKISTEQKELGQTKVEYKLDLKEASNSQLVIEAVSEDEGLKTQVFSTLNDLTPEGTIFATNTSSIPITRLGKKSGRPDRFMGIHFMNPVPLMNLVELIPGLATSQKTIQLAKVLVEDLGKIFIESRDYPGFVVNRVLMPQINEAFSLLSEGVASADDIDQGMKLGTNQPMGPLALGDFIGLDTCLAIMKVLHEGYGDPRYRPSPLLVQYVDAGWLGRKTGRGVYQYGR